MQKVCIPVHTWPTISEKEGWAGLDRRGQYGTWVKASCAWKKAERYSKGMPRDHSLNYTGPPLAAQSELLGSGVRSLPKTFVQVTRMEGKSWGNWARFHFIHHSHTKKMLHIPCWSGRESRSGIRSGLQCGKPPTVHCRWQQTPQSEKQSWMFLMHNKISRTFLGRRKKVHIETVPLFPSSPYSLANLNIFPPPTPTCTLHALSEQPQ